MFSPPSRRLSRSRPQSPTQDDMMIPPTPQIPADIWPLPSSPRTPTTPNSPFPSAIQYSRGPQMRAPSDPTKPGIISERKNRDAPRSDRDVPVNRQRRKTDATKTAMTSPSTIGQSKYTIDLVRPELYSKGQAYAGDNTPATPVHSSSLHRKKSKTGLRIPGSFGSLSRSREEPATLTRTKSQPSLRDRARPSTAGHDSRERPTGKRRRDGTTDGQSTGATNTPVDEVFPQHLQRRWQSTSTREERRTSVRSAVTASSSPVDSASTKRSSVLTKGTSVMELTVDPHSRPVSKAGGMTVEDTIDMYVNGFDDDPSYSQAVSRRPSVSNEEEQRRSIRRAEAMSDSLSSGLPSERPSISDAFPLSSVTSSKILPHDTSGPPPLMPPTTLRDQYGFVKASQHVTLSQYDAWYNQYLPNQERRTKKWISYLREQNLPTYHPTSFPQRSPKTQRYILKGIPPAWRGAAWFHYSGGEEYMNRHPDLYPSLTLMSENALPDSEKESIERDLHRTFPDNIHFKTPPTSTQSPSAEPPMLTSLRRVLRAFALHDPKIGYCQSLNFIAGLLLLFLPEEKAFVMLHIITTDFLPGTHSLNLEGANVDLWVLMLALKSTLPNVYAKIGAPWSADASPSSPDVNNSTDIRGDSTLPSGSATSVSMTNLPPVSLCTTSWFLSLFVSVLPTESTLRVWDALFYDGPRIMFRAALAIFRLGEKRIFAAASSSTPSSNPGTASKGSASATNSVGGGADSMELFQVVQQLPRTLVDAGTLMKTITRKEGVTNTWVWERRKMARSQRAHEAERVRAMSSEEVQGFPQLPPQPQPQIQSASDNPQAKGHAHWRDGDGETVAPNGRLVPRRSRAWTGPRTGAPTKPVPICDAGAEAEPSTEPARRRASLWRRESQMQTLRLNGFLK